MSHPGVLEAACIGVSDAGRGQRVKIVVVRRDPALTAEALLAHCREHLTAYKVPKFVQWSSEPLPKSPVGKILRRVVREQVAAEPAEASAAMA
jgi:long-chain acyl-CoA synthetase